MQRKEGIRIRIINRINNNTEFNTTSPSRETPKNSPEANNEMGTLIRVFTSNHRLENVSKL